MNSSLIQPFNYIIENLPGGIPLELIEVKGGAFIMDCEEHNREQPKHKVKVPDFYMGKYPITNRQYAAFLNGHSSDKVKKGREVEEKMITDFDWGVKRIEGIWKPTPGYEDHPVICVTWYGAVQFGLWLTENSEHEYRLPSELEWEYAARGGIYGSGLHYAGSNQLKEVGWFNQNSYNETKPVGLKQPNEFGIYDISGNVWEWCADQKPACHQVVPIDFSSQIYGEDSDLLVVRGGAWYNDDKFCRCVIRNWLISDFQYDYFIGFRLARY